MIVMNLLVILLMTEVISEGQVDTRFFIFIHLNIVVRGSKTVETFRM